MRRLLLLALACLACGDTTLFDPMERQPKFRPSCATYSLKKIKFPLGSLTYIPDRSSAPVPVTRTNSSSVRSNSNVTGAVCVASKLGTV